MTKPNKLTLTDAQAARVAALLSTTRKPPAADSDPRKARRCVTCGKPITNRNKTYCDRYCSRREARTPPKPEEIIREAKEAIANYRRPREDTDQ